MSSTASPDVNVLATGGTIANPLEIDGYLSGDELLSEIPELDDVANIEVTDIASVGSSEVGPEIWFSLNRKIAELSESRSPPDGIVVSHGSNTVEETAYFLNLTLETEIPVVLTAAQRNHRLIGNDGDRNLLDAVKVATSEEAVGRGVLVVLNDEIHGARDVTKIVSGRPDAWSSGNLGVLGLIDKRDNMNFYRQSERRHTPDTEFDITGRQPDDLPAVEVLYSYAGAGSRLVEATGDYADGLVLASLPTGAQPRPVDGPGQGSALDELVERGLPIVLSHRGFDGWPYPDDPFIWGDTLTPQKARILLTLGLMKTGDWDELQRMFTEY